jgi:hypothetical protein
MNSEIVPFGKYKNQPLETLLAHQSYLEWVSGQPGIMAMLQGKYPALFNVITVGAPQTDDTPEHNKMQALFLDRDFQHAFLQVVISKSVEAISLEVAERAKKVRAEIQACLPSDLRKEEKRGSSLQETAAKISMINPVTTRLPADCHDYNNCSTVKV